MILSGFIFSLPGRTQFKVVIKALSPKEVTRIYTPRPLDRNDGTFLMRYRMYGSVTKGLKIEILYGDQHVAQSPYILKGEGIFCYNVMCQSSELGYISNCSTWAVVAVDSSNSSESPVCLAGSQKWTFI